VLRVSSDSGGVDADIIKYAVIAVVVLVAAYVLTQ
jgi:hypothetical protein